MLSLWGAPGLSARGLSAHICRPAPRPVPWPSPRARRQNLSRADRKLVVSFDFAGRRIYDAAAAADPPPPSGEADGAGLPGGGGSEAEAGEEGPV